MNTNRPSPNSTPDFSNARELDELFAAWDNDQQSTSPTPLRDWLTRYPDHSRELATWTVAEPVASYAATLPDDAEAEARVLAAGMRVWERMKARTVSEPVIADLYQTARAKGIEPLALAAQLGVGLPIVSKLRQRLLNAATLPDALIARLAAALEVTGESLRAYFVQPATLALGAAYKANTAPRAALQEDFAHAIAQCPGMRDEDRTFWLSQTKV